MMLSEFTEISSGIFAVHRPGIIHYAVIPKRHFYYYSLAVLLCP